MLNLENYIWSGTDRCTVMISVIRDAVQHIKNNCVNAIHSPSANYTLNLSIAKFSNVKLVKNTMVIIKEVLSFFNMSLRMLFYFEK